MYRDYLQHPDTVEMSILQDLYEVLCKQTEPEAARLATSLGICVTGSLNVFSRMADVDLPGHLVCLDLKKLGAGLWTVTMLIMQDSVNSQVSLDFARRIATWYYFDEFRLLLKDPLTAFYCVTVWKMLREKSCVPNALIRSIRDLLASREIENIFGVIYRRINITL